MSCWRSGRSLARRVEAVLRVSNDPAPYARRLVYKLKADRREALRISASSALDSRAIPTEISIDARFAFDAAARLADTS